MSKKHKQKHIEANPNASLQNIAPDILFLAVSDNELRINLEITDFQTYCPVNNAIDAWQFTIKYGTKKGIVIEQLSLNRYLYWLSQQNVTIEEATSMLFEALTKVLASAQIQVDAYNISQTGFEITISRGYFEC